MRLSSPDFLQSPVPVTGRGRGRKEKEIGRVEKERKATTRTQKRCDALHLRPLNFVSSQGPCPSHSTLELLFFFLVCFQTISIEAIIRNAFNFSIVESFSCCREIALLVAFDTQAFDTLFWKFKLIQSITKTNWDDKWLTILTGQLTSGWVFPQKGL